MQPILTITNLSHEYKGIPALKQISLWVNPGEIFGLLGPDGAGKSTLIYSATGLLKPSQGEVRLLGTDMRKYPESVKASLGILPQGLGLSLAAELSVEENIDYFARINTVPPAQAQEQKNRLLEVTRLAPFKDRAAKNLSGGMKQKLGICCTLIHSPKMIFLDEPTTGVDPISRKDIWYLINKIVKEQGITIVLTTSYLDEAERCQRLALMHEGAILASGTMDELSAAFQGSMLEIQTPQAGTVMAGLKRLPEITLVYPSGSKLKACSTLDSADAAKSLSAYAERERLPLTGVEKVTPNLEDIFLRQILHADRSIDTEALKEFFSSGTDELQSLKTGDIMIEVKNLYKTFNKFTAVDNVSFQVKRGEIFGFLGPNGAGKTTTIKMLCGLFPPSAGKGFIGSFDISTQQWEIKQNIGYMSQKFSLYRDLTVGENIELYAGIYGVRTRELEQRKRLILRIADLTGKDRIITDSLPMGIKQRLALGCAIIHKPKIIFLDEPTSGVDPIARRIFWDLIFFLSRELKVTVLVTTHYMDEAEHCDRLSLMHMGRLIALGTPDALKDQVAGEIGAMLELLTNAPFDALDLLSRHFQFCNIFGRTIHLYSRNLNADEDKIKLLLQQGGFRLMEMRSKLIPFEDVFVYFCSKAENREAAA